VAAHLVKILIIDLESHYNWRKLLLLATIALLKNIITNAHVIKNADVITVILPNINTSDFTISNNYLFFVLICFNSLLFKI